MNRILAIAVLTITLVSAGSAFASPSANSSVSTTCTGLTGAKWKVSGGRTGTKYFAGVRGVTCAFVKPWVARLSGLRKANATIAGGPSGFTCRSAQRQPGEAIYGFTCFAAGKIFTVFPQV
jgi:hypothetical protein